MGYYINPANMSKEEWLREHGARCDAETALSHDFSSETIPVCLVHNGQFSAAGIGYCRREVEAFAYPDGRPKRWYLVKKIDLLPYVGEAARAPWLIEEDVVRGRAKA